MAGELRAAVLSVLAEARNRGFLGPGPLEAQAGRALDLAGGCDVVPERALDLGSGGGLPGLPLALAWPATTWVLLEGGATRSSFLVAAVAELGLADRVKVVPERAETAGRGPLRGTFDLVVARSFGPPAVTAECASPFLRPGGVLVVAEPPGGDPERWSSEGLGRLGMEAGRRSGAPTAYQVLVQRTSCPDAYPRRTGVPNKRPLF